MSFSGSAILIGSTSMANGVGSHAAMILSSTNAEGKPRYCQGPARRRDYAPKDSGCRDAAFNRERGAAQTKKSPIREEIGRQNRSRRLLDRASNRPPKGLFYQFNGLSSYPKGMTAPLTNFTRSPIPNGGR